MQTRKQNPIKKRTQTKKLNANKKAKRKQNSKLQIKKAKRK